MQDGCQPENDHKQSKPVKSVDNVKRDYPGTVL